MKKIFFVSLAGFLFANILNAQDKKQETIEGSGKLVTRTVAVSPFDALKASGVYELKLAQGNKEAVTIEADENLQQYIDVRNEGDKLVINMDKIKNKNFRSKNKIKIYVSFKKLKELDLRTVGNVVSDEPLVFDALDLHNRSVGNVDLNLTAVKLNLTNASVGNIKLKGKAQNAIVKNSGVGSLQAGNFVVETMNIETTGVGSAEVNAEKDLKVKDSFLGKVRNKGAAPVRKMNRVRV